MIEAAALPTTIASVIRPSLAPTGPNAFTSTSSAGLATLPETAAAMSGIASVMPSAMMMVLAPPTHIVSIMARGILWLASCTSSPRSPQDSKPKMIQMPIRLAVNSAAR